jgi:hypothetical protein
MLFHNVGSSTSNLAPPPFGSIKVNFDVVVRHLFSTLRLPHLDPSLGEASAALLGIRLALSHGCSSVMIEGDSLLTILALNQRHIFTDWPCALVIKDCHLQLSSFSF